MFNDLYHFFMDDLTFMLKIKIIHSKLTSEVVAGQMNV